jgi:hypothetical protein
MFRTDTITDLQWVSLRLNYLCLYEFEDRSDLKIGITFTQTLWPLFRKRTIPTEQQPFVGEI